MADSSYVVELKETIKKMNIALSQSYARIRELEEGMSATQNEMSKLQEENARLARDLKQIRQNPTTDRLSSCSDESDSDDEIFILGNMISDRSSSSCSARSSCSHRSDSNDDMISFPLEKKDENCIVVKDVTTIKHLLKRKKPDEGTMENNAKIIKMTNILNGDSKMNESDEAALNINSMPEEILIKIFGYLSHNKLGEIARVCTRWNVLTKNPVLWEKVYVYFSWIGGSQNFVAKCFINRLPPCVTCLILNFGYRDDWIDLLNFEELAMRLRKRCPLLVMLRLENAKLSVNLPSIIDLSTQLLRKLKKLAVHYSTFPNCPTTEEWDDNSKIKILDLYGCYITHYNKPPFSRMPHLKKLFLACTDVDDSWFEDDTFYLNQLHELDLRDTDISSRTFQIMQTHAVNLRKLCLCDTGVDLDEEDDLNFPHLKTICLRFNGVTCKNIVSLIQACHSLQNVYVDGHAVDYYEKHPFVNVNECKLGIVKDDCCSYIKSSKFYE